MHRQRRPHAPQVRVAKHKRSKDDCPAWRPREVSDELAVVALRRAAGTPSASSWSPTVADIRQEVENGQSAQAFQSLFASEFGCT